MIYESFYWKRDLAKRAAYLEEKLKQRRWDERSYTRLEQEIMLGFYSIRKLADAKKIPDKLVNKQITLMYFKSRGDFIHHGNWANVDRHYHLADGKKITKTLAYVANQLIHSFVFLPVHLEATPLIEGIAFNSDRTKSEVLFTMKMSLIVDTFYRAATEYNRKTKRMDSATGMTVYVVKD